MAYDIAAIRNKLRKQMSGKYSDPDEFRPPKAENTTDPLKFRFYILPPLLEGDKLKSGTVTKSMDHFFIAHANHWINDKPHPCPRVWDESECPICKFGFDLLRDEKDEDRRKSIVKQWMPNTYYMVNIYFTNSKHNPEDLRGKVRFYNAPKTCFDLWTSTLYKDGPGDPEEPEAYGVFFDENAAFVFQLEVLKQGRNNSYRTSHFLANDGNAAPMVRDKDGSANKKGIEALLKLRINLWEKLEQPDPEKIEKLARVMIDGDDLDSSGFDHDEESKPSTPSKKESAPSEPAEPAESTLEEEAPIEDETPESVESEDATSDPEPEHQVASTPVDDDDEGAINDLLSQLDGDD